AEGSTGSEGVRDGIIGTAGRAFHGKRRPATPPRAPVGRPGLYSSRPWRGSRRVGARRATAGKPRASLRARGGSPGDRGAGTRPPPCAIITLMSVEPLPTVPPEPDLDLEPAPPEVKRYQRQKLTAALGNTLLSLGFLAVMALWLGPQLDSWLRSWLGDNPWLRLLAVAAAVGVGLELLTLPLTFWSGFVLEHRYGLSNQPLGQWVQKMVKAYLVAGLIGLPLLFGLYALLRFAGPWWWAWAAAGWLLVTLVLG